MTTDGKGLKNKVIFAGGWVGGGHVLSQLLRFAGNLALTRLLAPDLFGIMAIASAFMMGIAMFSDIGLTQNIVQSKKATNSDYLGTAWAIQIIRGAGIFAIALIISYIVYLLGHTGFFPDGSVYSDPQLPKALSVMSVVALISGFNSINLALQNRNLMLKKVVLIEIFSQILGLSMMLILAWNNPSIWALVIGGIVSALSKMFLSHHSSLGVRYKMTWDRPAVLEIINFGKWVFVSSVFTFLAGQGDRLILGALITPEELGVYTIAFFLARALGGVQRKIVSSVFYPAISEVVRTRPAELRKVYYKIRGKIDVLIMIVAGLMASMGHLAVDFFYDERYQNAGWILEILSLGMLFLGTTMAGMCFMALGNTKVIAIMTALATITLYISVPIAYGFYGLYGAVFAITLNVLTQIPIIFYYLKKYNILNVWMEFRAFPVFLLCYGGGLLFIDMLK